MSELQAGQPTPIVMFGAAGRMGRMILEIAARESHAWRIVGAVEEVGHAELGRGLGTLIPGIPAGLKLECKPPENPPAGTVGIHFSLPAGTIEHLGWSRDKGIGAVIGTTGFSQEQLAEIEATGRVAPILLTPNTSTGVNALFWLAERAAAMLGDDYDIEITEMHHHHKKDAPSGTARRLAEVVLAARDGDYERDVEHGREGIVGERVKGRIGMHALRGGDVVGEHTLIFAGPGERIEMTHRAHTRETFARGALRAAAWLSGRVPGQYAMKDVLGL